MQRSPLQLEWVIYPSASFEALDTEHPTSAAQPSNISAHVIYQVDGAHRVELTISNADADGPGAAYLFKIEAVAGFSFNLDAAVAAYKIDKSQLPYTIAVNMARILYASAREYMSLITCRSIHGSLLIESVLIEPADVKIGSIGTRAEIMETVFGLPDVSNGRSTPRKRRMAKSS
jgi:hypothetical protein